MSLLVDKKSLIMEVSSLRKEVRVWLGVGSGICHPGWEGMVAA